MSKAKLTLEDARAIAAAILSRAQLTPSVAKTSDAPARKRGRPAKLKTAEELEHDADADDYMLQLSDGWMEKASQSRWSDDL